MTLVQFCGLAVLTAASVLLLRESHRSYAYLPALAFLLIGLVTAVSRTSETVSYLRTQVADSSMAPYFSVVLKAVGLAFLGQVTADLCRGAGEASMAGGVEVCTKAEIIVVSLPLVTEILQTAEHLL